MRSCSANLSGGEISAVAGAFERAHEQTSDGAVRHKSALSEALANPITASAVEATSDQHCGALDTRIHTHTHTFLSHIYIPIPLLPSLSLSL